MSTPACRSTPGVGKSPLGRRRSNPSSTSELATSSASHTRTSASVERKFRGGAKQLRPKDIRIARVDDDAFDGLVQQGGRVMNQVGVEGIVAGDQHDERTLPASARAPCLLPE